MAGIEILTRPWSVGRGGPLGGRSEAGPAARDYPARVGLAGRAQNSRGDSPPGYPYCRAQTAAPLLPRQAHPRRRLRMRPPSGPPRPTDQGLPRW